jgi:hypothetical protein
MGHRNPKKAASQDQLHALTLEAMAKTVLQVTSHQSYSDFFQNLHDGDEFATDVVTIGGPVERPVEIHTSALLLYFFPHTCSLSCFPPRCNGYNPEKKPIKQGRQKPRLRKLWR